MVKKILFVSILLLTFCFLFPQEVPRNIIQINEHESSRTPLNRGISYVALLLSDTAGAVPGLTQFWDYVSNGNNLKRLWVFGDTVIIAADYADSLNATYGPGRRSRIQISYNNGISWLSNPENLSVSRFSAYPEINPIIFQGARSYTLSGKLYYNTNQIEVYCALDSVRGSGKFRIDEFPRGREMTSSAIGNNLAVTYIGQYYDSLFFQKYNYLNGQSDVQILMSDSPSVDGITRVHLASNNIQNVFVMWNKGINFAFAIYGKESSDGGNTFGNAVTISQSVQIVNGDSTWPWICGDVVYRPGTVNYCTVYSFAGPGNLNTRNGCKLLFWSPGVNGGNPVVIADRTTTSIPILNNPALFSRLRKLQTGMTVLSHPSLSYSVDGTRLFCAFSVAQIDTTSYGYNYNDIYLSHSDDNGASWSLPVNVTNTSQADEIYPTLSKSGNTSANIALTYSLSEFPGSVSFSINPPPDSPIGRVYQIYKRCDITAGSCYSTVSINLESEEIPGEYRLSQNYPNPFNPDTKIQISIKERAFVKVRVFDISGKEITRLIERILNPGSYLINWNALNFASGVYFYSMQAGDPSTGPGQSFMQTRKMVLLK